MFRVIIAGSRSFNDYEYLKKYMDFLLQNKKEVVILCGEARGADALGKRYAQERGFPVQSFPADWQRFGRAAGPLRNRQMAACADACVVFWVGGSAGSASMVAEARRAGLALRVRRF